MKAQALETIVFHGKQYYVFPETFSSNSFYKQTSTIKSRDLTLNLHGIPVVNGNYPDGDYLVYYSGTKEVREKRKYKRIKVIYCVMTLKNSKKESWLKFVKDNKGFDDSIFFVNDQIEGKVTGVKSESEYNRLPLVSKSSEFRYSIGNISLVYLPIVDAYREKAELNFNAGVLNGDQYFYTLNKKLKIKDERRLKCKDGVLEGPFEFIYRNEKGKTLWKITGKIKDLHLDSVFVESYMNKKSAVLIFNNSNELSKEIISQADTLLTLYYENEFIQSILDEDNGKSCFNFPNNFFFFNYTDCVLNEINKDFLPNLVLIRKRGEKVDTLIGTKEHVNSAFLKEVRGVLSWKDTVLFGQKCSVLNSRGGTVLIENDSSVLGNILCYKCIEKKAKMEYTDEYYLLEGKYKKDQIYFKLNNRFISYYNFNDIYFMGRKSELKEFSIDFNRKSYMSVNFELPNDTVSPAIKHLKFKYKKYNFEFIDTIQPSNYFKLHKDVYFDEWLVEDLYYNAKYMDLNQRAIFDFLKVESEKHARIYLNGSPFNGKFEFSTVHWRKQKIKIKTKYINNDKTAIDKVVLYYYKVNRNSNELEDLKAFFKDGFFHNAYNSRIKYEYFYNKLDKSVRSYHLEGNSIKTKFDKGKSIGMFLVENNDYGTFQFYYINGKLNGRQYFYKKSGILNAIIETKNNLFHGFFEMYNDNGYKWISGNFLDGLREGEFKLYNKSDDSQGTLLVRHFYKDGFRVDTSVLFNNDGLMVRKCFDFHPIGNMNPRQFNLKEKISNIKYRNQLSGFDVKNEMKSNNMWSLYNSSDAVLYQFTDQWFYQSGNLFAEGSVSEDRMVDTWRFYREDKSVYKMYIYNSSYRYNDGAPTEKLADVFAYYPNGKLMYKGITFTPESLNSCDNELGLPIEKIEYTEFYDENGNSVLDKNEPKVVEYLPGGGKLREGLYVNGKREGVWIEYSIFGVPKAIGRYENGLKTGLWIEGDISGINFPENVCFLNEEEYEFYMETEGKKLDFVKLYYVNDQIVSKDDYRSQKK